MKNKLAIIIPAYKARFFREVLDSIVRQSNRDFTVYIGDDASPDDLESIVSDYKDKLDIFYFRFEQNWGGRDLVAHWERCIELSDEPLVWLFSDDDLRAGNKGLEEVWRMRCCISLSFGYSRCVW